MLHRFALRRLSDFDLPGLTRLLSLGIVYTSDVDEFRSLGAFFPGLWVFAI
jgi:hypothetical protein